MSDMNVKGMPDNLAQVSAGMIQTGQEAIKDRAAQLSAIQQDNQQAQLTDDNRDSPVAAASKNLDKKIKPNVTAKTKQSKSTSKQLLPVKELEEKTQNFSNNNPKLFPRNKLEDLINKLKDGMTKEDILELIPDPMEATLALEFLISITTDDLQKNLQSIQNEINQEIFSKREDEVSGKIAAEAAEVTQEATVAALQIVQGGDLNKLLDHLMINPLEAPAVYKMLDDAFGNKLKKIELFLLKKCSDEIKDLKELDDGENIARMKVAMRLLKMIQAIMGVDRYFEIRNPPERRKNAEVTAKRK